MTVGSAYKHIEHLMPSIMQSLVLKVFVVHFKLIHKVNQLLFRSLY